MASETVAKDRLATMEDYAAADFPALLSKDETELLEKNAQSFGISRRIGFGVLTRSKAELVQSMQEDGADATFTEMLELIEDYQSNLRNQLEAMEMATIRLIVGADRILNRPAD